jgi:lipoprotein-anchoring transpeptidase ErfK/SrfK
MIDLITSVVVDLSEQKLYAYNGDQVVRTILVSSGKASNPTPTFESQVESKHTSVTMQGRGYVAPGVPWALCMPGGMICLHGAPWQEAAGEPFGVPRSHGCVRMPTSQARWLFQRVNPGTPVTVQL